MKREIEFIKSMTEKLKTQGDISAKEAAYIFLLATVTYAYEMGSWVKGQYLNSFDHKFDFSEMSKALNEWYEEVFSQVSDKFSSQASNDVTFNKRYNFITSILSPRIYSATYASKNTLYMMRIVKETWRNIKPVLEKNIKISDSFCVNDKMFEWLKDNLPLSFDIIRHYEIYELENNNKHTVVDLARFGVLGLLPIYEKEVEAEKIQALSKIDIPFLRSQSAKEEMGTDFYWVACPSEYKDILDAVANDLPIPEVPPERTDIHTPKDIEYINSLTARLPFQDITEEEADNIYLLLKTYQALRVAALREDSHFRRQTQNAVEPGLNVLLSWYKAVEKELKKSRSGNFVYTLPSDLNMNLYQLRKPIAKCLEKLPKEPPEVAVRNKEDLPIKDVFLDTRCARESVIGVNVTEEPGICFCYRTSRYGFFKRNGINLKEWKPVLQFEGDAGHSILNSSYSDPFLGKLRFAELSLGIKYIVIGDVVAVREKDRQKMLEVLSLSNEKIMHAAKFAIQIDLNKIRDKLSKNPHDEQLVSKEKWLRATNYTPLEYIIRGIEMIRKAQKDREEYIEDGSWMDVER